MFFSKARFSKQKGRELLNKLRTIYKIGKYKFTTCIIRRRACEDGDGDDDESSDGPRESPLCHVRKQRIAKGVQQERYEIISDIDQELMPALRGVILVHKRYDSNYELTP